MLCHFEINGSMSSDYSSTMYMGPNSTFFSELTVFIFRTVCYRFSTYNKHTQTTHMHQSHSPHRRKTYIYQSHISKPYVLVHGRIIIMQCHIDLLNSYLTICLTRNNLEVYNTHYYFTREFLHQSVIISVLSLPIDSLPSPDQNSPLNLRSLTPALPTCK